MIDSIEIIEKLTSSCQSIKRDQVWEAALNIFTHSYEPAMIENYLKKEFPETRLVKNDELDLCFLIAQYLTSHETKRKSIWFHISMGAIIIEKAILSLDTLDYHDIIEKNFDLIMKVLYDLYGDNSNNGLEVASDLLCRLLFSALQKLNFHASTETTIVQSFIQSRIKCMKDSLANFTVCNAEAMDSRFLLSLRVLSELLDYSVSSDVEHLLLSKVANTMEASLDNDLTFVVTKCNISTRKLVISRVFPHLLLLSAKSVDMSERVADKMVSLCIALWTHSNKMDLSNSLLILCILLSQSVDYLSSLCSSSRSEEDIITVWSIVQTGILHPDILLRKRALFILQTMFRHPAGLDDKLNWTDFIEIFNVIEACNSVHLIEQVLPRFDRLFQNIARSSSTTQFDEAIQSLPVSSRQYKHKSLLFPVMTFHWAKSTLHCLLYSSTPNVRRVALNQIFTGRVTLAASKATTRWLCQELLQSLIDNVSYFSAYYLDSTQPLGCVEAVTEVKELFSANNQVPPVVGGKNSKGEFSRAHDVLATARLNPETYPGIMLPLFLSRLVTVYLHVDDLNGECSANSGLTSDLIKSLVSTVCRPDGMKSLSAANWVMRTFSETVVLKDLPRCLGRRELEEIKTFVSGRLASTNSMIRDRILTGLLPLAIRSAELSYITENSSGVCAAFIRTLLPIVFDLVSPSILFQNPLTCKLLADTTNHVFLSLLDKNTNSSEVDKFMADCITPSDLKMLAMASVLAPPKENDCRWIVAMNTFQNAASLYHSVYMPPLHILGIVSYFHGLFCITSMKSKHVDLTSFPGELNQSLRGVSTDVARYLSTVLKSTINQVVTESSAVTSVDNGVIDSISTLEMFVDVLVGLLQVPGLSDDATTSIMTEVLTVVHCLFTHISNIQPSSSTLTKLFLLRSTNELLSQLESLWNAHLVSKLTPSLLSDLLIAASGFNALLLITDQFTTISGEEVLRCVEASEGMPEDNQSKCYHPIVKDMIVVMCKSRLGRAADTYASDRWTIVYVTFSILQVLPVKEGCTVSIKDAMTSLLSQLEVCSPSSVAPLLHCCAIIIKQALSWADQPAEDKAISKNEILQLCEETINKCCFAAFNTTERMESDIVRAFVSVAFNDTVLAHLPMTATQTYFDQLMCMGRQKKPHIITAVALQLCSVWIKNPNLIGLMLDQVTALLLCKEPRLEDHSSPDTDYTEDVFNRESAQLMQLLDDTVSASRIMTLTVLEHVFHDASFTGVAHDLIRKLFNLNFTPRFSDASMIGTESFGDKLRCWQALCVLAPSVNPDIGAELVSDFMKILGDTCVHTIRVHLEIFGAALCRQAPSVTLPCLLNELSNFNHIQQKAASLFVILGHIYANDNLSVMEASQVNHSEFFCESTYRKICHLLMAWMSCSNGLPRQLAQMIVNILVPRLTEFHHNQSNVPVPPDDLILVHIYNYLNSNKDSLKTLQRQKEFYTKFALVDRCSLRGLLALQSDYADVTGEIIPPHLLTVVEAFLKAEFALEMQSQYAQLKDTSSLHLAAGASSEEVPVSSPTQIKRLPFDDLQLAIDEKLLNRQRNQAGRKRQELIVCASLIDKAINLAGIARTCEIFAVNSLILPNMAVTRTDTFQGIAVSSANWLPMAAVPESELLVYLRSMRKQGYCIVALEQSDSSRSLADPNNIIPERSVLLLGKEKEGVPVEFLAEVDVCVEIPQFGVTRSLNVHVSAAIYIFEATRRNREFNTFL